MKRRLPFLCALWLVITGQTEHVLWVDPVFGAQFYRAYYAPTDTYVRVESSFDLVNFSLLSEWTDFGYGETKIRIER